MKQGIRRSQYIAAGALLLLVAGSSALYLVHKPHVQKYPANVTHVISHSTANPSEQKATPATYTWHGSPTDPKYIKLPSIAAEGFVQNMGIDQHNAIAAPSNINFAGWYVNSARPGESGLSIIDGHVDGVHAPGIFYRLGSLHTGDVFSLEFGSGATYQFQVKAIATVSDDQAVNALFARDNTIPSQLNLITCGGSYDRQSHLYTKRVIVTSAKM